MAHSSSSSEAEPKVKTITLIFHGTSVPATRLDVMSTDKIAVARSKVFRELLNKKKNPIVQYKKNWCENDDFNRARQYLHIRLQYKRNHYMPITQDLKSQWQNEEQTAPDRKAMAQKGGGETNKSDGFVSKLLAPFSRFGGRAKQRQGASGGAIPLFRQHMLEKAIQIVHTEDKAAADEMRLLNAIVTGYKEYVIQLEQSCERVLAVAPDIDRLQLLLSGKPRRRVVTTENHPQPVVAHSPIAHDDYHSPIATTFADVVIPRRMSSISTTYQSWTDDDSDEEDLEDSDEMLVYESAGEAEEEEENEVD